VQYPASLLPIYQRITLLTPPLLNPASRLPPPSSGVFLMASSRWNQTAAPDEALARLSEVVDWEEGGRTLPQHVSRIFDKEKEDGERRVLVVMRRVRPVWRRRWWWGWWRWGWELRGPK
jgi:hypothetical protein